MSYYDDGYGNSSENTKASAKTGRAIFSERQESSFTLNVEKLLGSVPRYPYNRVLAKKIYDQESSHHEYARASRLWSAEHPNAL